MKHGADGHRIQSRGGIAGHRQNATTEYNGAS
jgi:hypothetical protein